MTTRFLRRLAPMLLIFWVALNACKNSAAPDVSNIHVKLQIDRFDKYLFQKIDTVNIAQGVADLQSTYPFFTNDFIINILGLPGISRPLPDSAIAYTLSELKRFINLTTPVYDSLAPKFVSTDQIEKSLAESFKYVKYYYPAYRIPRIVFYVGPFDAPGIAITNEALAVGLQLYAGSNFSFYQSETGQEMFPAYISKNFDEKYIPVNAIKAVADDIYPDRSIGRPLIEQMIEKGKLWYLTRRFMPELPDSLITGYTNRQVNWNKSNEGSIWNFILQSNDLYTTEPILVKNYLGDSPNTQGMPDEAPGNIGQWIGWQIVERYAAKNTALKPAELLKTDAKKIFSEAKYKPRN